MRRTIRLEEAEERRLQAQVDRLADQRLRETAAHSNDDLLAASHRAELAQQPAEQAFWEGQARREA